MSSVTCELCVTVPNPPNAANVLVTVPRSTCRYSILAVHGPEITHSTPPPTVQPPRVVLALAIALAVVGPTIGPFGRNAVVVVVLAVAVVSTSPNANPPVT